MSRLAKTVGLLALIEVWAPTGTTLGGDAGDTDNAASQPARSTVPAKPHASRTYRQRVWTREHGLPDNRVLSLIQTRDGYLWIGTGKGLARFDGLVFTLLNRATHEEFLSEECTALAEDNDGGLWIGTTARLNQLALLSDSGVSPVAGETVAVLARDAARSLDEIVWAVQPGKDRLDHLVSHLTPQPRVPVGCRTEPAPGSARRHPALAAERLTAPERLPRLQGGPAQHRQTRGGQHRPHRTTNLRHHDHPQSQR